MKLKFRTLEPQHPTGIGDRQIRGVRLTPLQRDLSTFQTMKKN